MKEVFLAKIRAHDGKVTHEIHNQHSKKSFSSIPFEFIFLWHYILTSFQIS